MKVDLKNDFSKGGVRYPKNRQGTLTIIYKYTNYSVSQQNTSEGTSFLKRDGASNKQLPPYDKKY